MKYRPIKKVYLDTERMNQLLKMVGDVPESVRWEKHQKDTFVSSQIYVWEEAGCVNVVGRFLLETKIRHYKHMLDDRKVDENLSEPVDIIRAFKSKYLKKMDNLVERNEDWKQYSVAAIQYHDKKHEGQLLPDCYCYDLNSAYAVFALESMPDTTRPLGYGMVEEGQIGFRDTGRTILHIDKYTGKQEVRCAMTVCEPGEYAKFRFPLIDSPFAKYFENQWKKKSKPKNDTMKRNAKNSIVIAVGAMQNINPFYRITIVDRANKFIKKWSDENTVFCNTDSIVSLVKRDDLTIGDGLGEFKVEAHGDFTYMGANYEWSTGKSAHRGKTDIIQRFDRENWRIENI